MAKKMNVKSVSYKVTADVVTVENGAFEIHEGVTVYTYGRGKREQTKRIADKFDGMEVIAIRNLESVREEHITPYTVDASNAAIINACIAYGLDVYMTIGDEQILCTNDSESESESESVEA